MLDLFVKWLVPFLCGAAVNALVMYFALFRALRNGVQCLLRAEIIRSHEKYVARGYCPVHIKESLRREYTAYRKLNDNDVATGMYRELLALPVAKTNELPVNKDKDVTKS